jgi:cyclophilin family peptidyl-prolyl cis-trans isomerase
MHTQVKSVFADNRMGVTINLSGEGARASTVSTNSIIMTTAGPNGTFGNSDDVRIGINVSYSSSKKQITIRPKNNPTPNTRYRVKIFASRLLGKDGHRLDGEFTGKFNSGNGTPGGDFIFQTTNDTSAQPTVRFQTNFGNVDIKLFRGSGPERSTPITVAYFLGIINARSYDNLFIHRLARDFVIQFGGLNLNSQGQIGQTPSPNPVGVQAEPGNNNLRGTVAFALGGGQADNEIFFNMANNDGTNRTPQGQLITPNLDDGSNGGPFTAFAKVRNSSSQAVLNAINNLSVVNLDNDLGGLGSSVDSVPIKAGASSPLDPQDDFVLISRTALGMRVTKAS